MLCPGAILRTTRCSSDAVAEKKSAKLAVFTQEFFPGGLFGGFCLISWLWWTVSWTLRLHSALRCETQCHTPPSQSRLGLQVASCLPVFFSSGTAGAINQSPPQFTPVVSVCEGLTSNTALQGCLLRSSGGTLLCVFFLFPGFSEQSHLTFSCCGTFLYNHANLLTVLPFLPPIFTWGHF